MFEPVVIVLILPRMFAVEFLRRLPNTLKLGTIYSYVDEVKGNSSEIDLNFSNNINLIFDSNSAETIRIRAEIFEEKSREDYTKFINKIGYTEKEFEKVYQVLKIR
jgi:hypothetical protein